MNLKQGKIFNVTHKIFIEVTPPRGRTTWGGTVEQQYRLHVSSHLHSNNNNKIFLLFTTRKYGLDFPPTLVSPPEYSVA